MDTDPGSFTCDDAADAGDGGREWKGRVTSVSPAGFDLRSCGSDDGCIDVSLKVSMGAHGARVASPSNGTRALDLTHALAVGDEVKLSLSQTHVFGCHFNLSVESVPAPKDSSDAGLSQSVVLLAIVEGGTALQGPLFIEKQLLCKAESSQASSVPRGGLAQDEPGSYALRFGSRTDGASVLVSMGQSGTLAAAVGSEQRTYRMYDARSYQVDGTDAYWDWAFWVQLER